MKVFSKKWESIFERHPATQELIDLHEARLSESRGRRIREHVLSCSVCQITLQHIGDFFEPARTGEPALSGAELEQRLERLWRNLPFEERAYSGWGVARSAGIWRAAALAAGLATLLIAVGALQVWRLYTRAEGQLAAMQRQDRDGRLQAESRQQRAEAQFNSKTAELSQELQQLRSPHLNIPVMEVFSNHERDSGQAPRPVLRVPANAPIVVLVLNSESEDRSGRYSVEIRNSLGQAVWSGQGLQRDPEMDRYTISIPSDRLVQGDYVISVYGEAGRSRLRVDRYSFRIVHDR